MTNKAIETLAKIRDLWAELLPAINAIVDEKPAPKPLLADAKVGDWVELQSGEKQVITDIIHKPDFLVIWIGSNLYNVDGVSINYSNITRLIPAGTPEWRELEVAEAKKKYPNLNPDLSKVRNGDKLLFSNGEIRTAIRSNGDTFLNANSPVVIGEPYSQTFLKKDGSHRQLGVICLGILPRQYITLEIVERMEKGLTQRAYSKSLDKILVWHGNRIWEVCKDRENAYKTYTVDSRFLTATDWEEIC